MHKLIPFFILIAGVALLAGCATTTTAEAPELVRAREAYQRAQADPAVRANAPVVLHDAREALDRAESADGEAEREHYAYMVQKKVNMAEAIAEAEALESEITQLQERRENIVAERRQQEIQSAQQRAAEARQQAEMAQAELQQMREAQRLAEVRQYQQQAEQAREESRQLRQDLEKMTQMSTSETERGIMLSIGDVLFETDKAALKPGATLGLGKLVPVLKEHPERKILIEGHTDSRGSAAYNEQLSQQRAQAVADFLSSQGIDPNRIMAKGYGEAYPVATNETTAGRQQNRRVDIVLLDQARNFEQSMRDAGSTALEQES